jgi:hypothetical protein
MKKVFHSPGPFATTDTWEVVDFGDFNPTENELNEEGFQRAIEHFENYIDVNWENGEPIDEDGICIEFDFCWFNIDDPKVEGRI